MSAKNKTVALCGNPNVGKSTVFNALTGLKQHTGNWAGKTVELSFGNFTHEGVEYELVDLPGIYSYSARSHEQEIARDFITSGEADCVVVVCDATALERNLHIVLRTLEICGNVIVALNMIDEAEKQKALDTAICDCYIKILLLSLAQQCKEHTSKDIKSKAMTERIKEWIRLHACEGITVRDVAAAFTYNPDYLTQLIKADTGMTLCGYINNIRLAMAKDLLLNSNLNIAQIAYKVGFSDEKYFLKLFRRKENVTPTQYRNSYSRTHINNK